MCRELIKLNEITGKMCSFQLLTAKIMCNAKKGRVVNAPLPLGAYHLVGEIDLYANSSCIRVRNRCVLDRLKLEKEHN